MKAHWIWNRSLILVALLSFSFMVGCEDSSDGPFWKGHNFGDQDPNTISVIGDSIAVWTNPTWPQILAQRIGKRVVNRGVPGEQSSSAPQRTSQALSGDNCGFLIIHYGANDAIFGRSPVAVAESLRAAIRAAKGQGTIPILGNVMPMYKGRIYFQSNIDRINVQVALMAKEENVRVVDLAAIFKKDPTLLDDGLHPTPAGSAAIAAAFANVLL